MPPLSQRKERKMADINFGKVFGTLSKETENPCQIAELTSAFTCENPASKTIEINGYLNEERDIINTETIFVCADCLLAI